jgi:prepilin-type N-terminal cleavage/methylation domain-containing protein
MRRKQAGERSGFTLIEMMIVVVIIAVLATVAIVAYTRHIKSSRLVDAKGFIAAIQARQEMYFQQWGYYMDASGGDTWHPTGTEPLAKDWNTSLPAGWTALGARPESGSAYLQFQVRASAADAHALFGSATTLGIPAQPAGILPHPWYYIIGRGNLDGGTDCTGTTPWSPAAEPDCTFLWATSARTDIVIGSEGK